MKPQDNPFAKGVSINQDMVMEEGVAYDTVNPVSENSMKAYHEKCVGVALKMAFPSEEEKPLTGRERLEKDVDREIAEQVINWIAQEERHVLALGREEE